MTSKLMNFEMRVYLVATCLFIGAAAFSQSVTISGKISDDINRVTLSALNEKTLTYDELGVSENNKGLYQFRLNTKAENLLVLDFAGRKKVQLSFTNEPAIEVNYIDEKIEIRGSADSLAMLSFAQEIEEMQGRYFGQLKKDADAAMASGDQAAMKEIQERSAKAIQQFLPELRQWIVDKGEGPAGYHAIQFSDFNRELEFIETRLAAFQQKFPNSPVTKALAKQVYRAKVISIGKAPPAIKATDRDGNPFSIDKYEGKVLLIDFWASWCRACRIENPQYVKIYQTYHEKGFEVVSISQDESEDDWNEAIRKDGVGAWRHVWDKDKSICDLYGVSSLPQNVVLGRDGKIIGKNVNAEQLERILAKEF